LWLGRSEPRKRLDLLLEAYKLLLVERQDVLLKIIGGFSWAEGYKKLIDEFEFPEYINYLPSIPRTKVPELLAQCDFLIQPSEGENFGTSVAEALCCGLPVIIGPTNGTKDYIGSSSFVFDEYSPQSLKDTMLRAIQSIEQEREKLSHEARLIAEANFDLSIVTDRLEEILREVLTCE
jgi:glycosyltransferase involved in cell wall biosynthesis